MWDRSNASSTEVIRKMGRIDAHAAVKERARLKKKRKSLHIWYHMLIILLCGGISIFFLVECIISKEDILVLLLFSISFGIPALKALYHLLFTGIGNIATMESSQIIGKGYIYALYLRAFKSDIKRGPFREINLVSSIEQKLNMFTIAVGLPEEVDASLGAYRVYISNDNWQEEVRLLINDATCIFIRICYTENCIWELKEALSTLKEIFIIIDNEEEFEMVREQCPELPKQINIKDNSYVIYRRLDDGTWQNAAYEKYEEDYQKEFVRLFLDKYPIREDATAQEYDKSILEMYSEMKGKIDGFNHNHVLTVASRILDYVEIYVSKHGSEAGVMRQAHMFLRMFDRFNPLSEELINKKERLEKEIG